MEKYCPLFLASSEFDTVAACKCKRAECGFYVPENNCCALVSIAREVQYGAKDIQSSIEGLDR